MKICERFLGITPFDIRKEKISEVFILVRRLNIYDSKNKTRNKIRKPAGDSWF